MREPGRGWTWPALVKGSAALHAAAAGAVLWRPSLWPWIAGGLVADHALLVAAGLSPRSALLGPNATRLPAKAARNGEVALTFDDGPDPETTPGILRLLEERGAKATFFCIGRRVGAARELVAEAARAGHAVGNHTWRHSPLFFFHPPSTLRREIARCQEELERAAGTVPIWFRAPAGIRSPILEPALAAEGLRLASWTRRAFDTVTRDPVRAAGRLTRGLSAGDILLLHDGSSARDPAGRPVVLDALARVLDAMEENGLVSVPMAPAVG